MGIYGNSMSLGLVSDYFLHPNPVFTGQLVMFVFRNIVFFIIFLKDTEMSLVVCNS